MGVSDGHSNQDASSSSASNRSTSDPKFKLNPLVAMSGGGLSSGEVAMKVLGMYATNDTSESEFKRTTNLYSDSCVYEGPLVRVVGQNSIRQQFRAVRNTLIGRVSFPRIFEESKELTRLLRAKYDVPEDIVPVDTSEQDEAASAETQRAEKRRRQATRRATRERKRTWKTTYYGSDSFDSVDDAAATQEVFRVSMEVVFCSFLTHFLSSFGVILLIFAKLPKALVMYKPRGCECCLGRLTPRLAIKQTTLLEIAPGTDGVPRIVRHTDFWSLHDTLDSLPLFGPCYRGLRSSLGCLTTSLFRAIFGCFCCACSRVSIFAFKINSTHHPVRIFRILASLLSSFLARLCFRPNPTVATVSPQLVGWALDWVFSGHRGMGEARCTRRNAGDEQSHARVVVVLLKRNC
jgi:hypothetical protein